jgi:hypothetical protein
MIANIWHWWLGVLLTFASLGVVLLVVAGYLKTVTSKQYPSKRQRRDD